MTAKSQPLIADSARLTSPRPKAIDLNALYHEELRKKRQSK